MPKHFCVSDLAAIPPFDLIRGTVSIDFNERISKNRKEKGRGFSPLFPPRDGSRDSLPRSTARSFEVRVPMFSQNPRIQFPFSNSLSLSVFLSLSLLFAREISTHRKRSKILKGLIKEERNMCKCRIYKSGAQLSALVRSLWSSCCTRGLKLYTRPSRSLGQTHTSVIPDPDLNSAVSIHPRPPSEKTFSDLLRLSIPSPSPILPDPFSFV